MAENRTLDTKGLNCPLPVLKARRAMRDMKDGDILTVLVTGVGPAIELRAGSLTGTIARAGFAWTGKSPAQRYVILFRPGGSTGVEIVAVLDGAQDWPSLLGGR